MNNTVLIVTGTFYKDIAKNIFGSLINAVDCMSIYCFVSKKYFHNKNPKPSF